MLATSCQHVVQQCLCSGVWELQHCRWQYVTPRHFSDQISLLSKFCYSHIRKLRCMRPYLDSKTASTIAASMVHSKLDYCNSLYYNLPKSQINRLQQIQNCLARSVVKTPKSSHITPILRSLHWLKINDRIEYTSLIRSLSSPITASTFHSRLITHLFHKSFPP